MEVMTKEETLKRLKTFKSNTGMTELSQVLEVAIKSLEKDLVLDKIRAEIENHCGLTKEDHCRYCSYCNNVMGVREVLEIFDKYMSKSETI